MQKLKQELDKKKKLYHSNKREIIVSICLVILVFGSMLGYLVYFTETNEQEMINNSYNSRQQILLSRNYRGMIYSRDGDVLAETSLDWEENEQRVYPYGNLFAHVVGYATEGKMGIEALANFYLINSNVSISEKVANDTAGIKNPGDNVYTTLDVELQKIADEQLGLYDGAVVVTEVKTGKILAMASNPDFDPNKIDVIWDDLIKNKESSVLVNRAVQGLYPPGSTFKIITALEYIRENPKSYDQYSFQCPGYFKVEGNLIHCYNSSVHGRIDLKTSFAKSCNSSFANIGVNLDKESFAETLDKLLFNQKLPIALSHEMSTIQVDENTAAYEMMQTAIGQGKTLITPLHLNLITCAVANKGILMKPYLIDHVESSDGKIVKTFKQEEYGRLLSETESEVLTELMAEVVISGTARRKLGQMEYTAAGKTGSAEYNDELTVLTTLKDVQSGAEVV